MTEVKVVNEKGNTLNLLDVDGHYFPTFPTDVIRGVPDLKVDSSDILISGYPKSGTHLLFEVSRALLRGKCIDDNVEKDNLMIEQMPRDHIDKMPLPRVLNTHIPFSMVPKDVFVKRIKMLYLLRNPKDSAVSFYNHHRKLEDYYNYHGSFSNYLPLWMAGKVDYGSWFDHVQTWTQGLAKCPDVPSLTIVYEDYMENSMKELQRINEHLGTNRSEAFLKEVRDWCSFDSMRNRKGKHDLARDGQPIMYRKGQVGNWREWFTVAQSEDFDQLVKRKLIDSNLTFRYTL